MSAGADDPLAGLGAEDYEALARQGFVAAERRPGAGGPRGPSYKLRWRRGGRQRARYLGRDPGRAAAVGAALADLQRAGRAARRAARVLREAARWLRRARRALGPPLAGRGLRLHGYAARGLTGFKVLKFISIS
jgi:hypothetical protein